MKKITKFFAVFCSFTAAVSVSAADIAGFLPAETQAAVYFSMPAVAASSVLPANGIVVEECLAEAGKKNPEITPALLTARIVAGGMWNDVNDPASGKGVIVLSGSEELINGCCAKADADENCTAVTFAGYEGYNVNNLELAAKNISAVGIKINANTVLLAINMDEAAVAACAAGNNSNILADSDTDGCFFAAVAENTVNPAHPFGLGSMKVFEENGYIALQMYADLQDAAEADKIEAAAAQFIAGIPALAAAYGIAGLDDVWAAITCVRQGNKVEVTIPRLDAIAKAVIPVIKACKEQQICWEKEECDSGSSDLY